MRTRIHVFGASGSGTSTIGRAIAADYGLSCFEADDFFGKRRIPRIAIRASGPSGSAC